MSYFILIIAVLLIGLNIAFILEARDLYRVYIFTKKLKSCTDAVQLKKLKEMIQKESE